MNPENAQLLSDFMSDLKNGQVAVFGIEGDDLTVSVTQWKNLRDVLSDFRYIATLCMLNRPGHAYYQRYLEMVHFHPSSPDNELLVSLVFRWEDLLWGVTLLPRHTHNYKGEDIYGEQLMREALALSGLRAIEGALPAMAGGDMEVMDETKVLAADPTMAKLGFVSPNLPAENLLYLENVADHPVYKNEQEALEAESQKIEALDAERREWKPE